MDFSGSSQHLILFRERNLPVSIDPVEQLAEEYQIFVGFQNHLNGFMLSFPVPIRAFL